MSIAERNSAALAGVKRKLTQTAITESRNNYKIQKAMDKVLQESSGAQMWDIPSSDNFTNTKTHEIRAEPTELTNDEVVFKVRSGDKYLHMNSLRFKLNVGMQKNIKGVWSNVPSTEKISVLPGAVVNILRENLEVRMIHPGDSEDTKVINVKQDNQRYLSRMKYQRSYDKLYCEKELKSSMQIVKEQTYPFIHDVASDATLRAGKPDAAFGKRDITKEVKHADGSILKICEEFGDELRVGKDFIIYAPVMDPVFECPILSANHGLKINFKLGRDDEHSKYIEEYTKRATAVDEGKYRFIIQKTSSFKVSCCYETSDFTTSALEKYNETFKNNKTVDVATFMAYKLDHRTVEKNSTELLNLEFPNTSDVPSIAVLELKNRDDFNHTSVYANYFDNSFLRYVKQIKFSNADILNPAYRDGVNVIDLNEEIDREGLYKSFRRYMLGREHVNMSDMYPAYFILNGASSELYNN